MSSKLDDTREVIAGNPGLVSGFVRCLGRLLREGKAGSSTTGMPPHQYQPALSMLGVFHKRFLVAAALARMAALDLIRERAAREGGQAPVASSDWILAADLMAARWVFDSAQALDNVDPTIAFHGISLALASQHLMERSLPGFRPPEIAPAATRLQCVASFFQEYLLARGMPREQAEERRDSARNIIATLDVLRQAAIESGEFDPVNLEPSRRWQRHMMPGAAGA